MHQSEAVKRNHLGSSSRERISAIVGAHPIVRTHIMREILDMKESGKRQAFDLQPLQEGFLGAAEMHADGDTAQCLPYPSSLPYLYFQLETIRLLEGKACPP